MSNKPKRGGGRSAASLELTPSQQQVHIRNTVQLLPDKDNSWPGREDEGFREMHRTNVRSSVSSDKIDAPGGIHSPPPWMSPRGFGDANVNRQPQYFSNTASEIAAREWRTPLASTPPPAVASTHHQSPSPWRNLNEDCEPEPKKLLYWTTKARRRDLELLRRRKFALAASRSRDYDPYAHRQSIDNLREWMAFMLLANAIISSTTLLHAPTQCMYYGIVLYTLGMILLTVIILFCCHILFQCELKLCRTLRVPWLGYPRVVLFAFKRGPALMRVSARVCWIVFYVVLVGCQLFVAVVYTAEMAMLLRNLVHESVGIEDTRMYTLMLAPGLLILNLLPTLRSIVAFSTLGCLTVFTAAVTLVVAMVMQRNADSPIHPWPQTKEWLVTHKICATFLALNTIPVVHSVDNRMRNPRKLLGAFGILFGAVCVSALMNVCVGISGYCCFGDDTKLQILDNLVDNDLTAAVMGFFLAELLLSHSLIIFSAYDLIWLQNVNYWLRGFRTKHRECWGVAVRLLLVALTTLIAIFVYSIKKYDLLITATILPIIVIGVPALVEICLMWEKQDYGRCNCHLFKDIMLIIFATYFTIRGIVAIVRNEI